MDFLVLDLLVLGLIAVVRLIASARNNARSQDALEEPEDVVMAMETEAEMVVEMVVVSAAESEAVLAVATTIAAADH